MLSLSYCDGQFLFFFQFSDILWSKQLFNYYQLVADIQYVSFDAAKMFSIDFISFVILLMSSVFILCFYFHLYVTYHIQFL